MKDKIYWRRVPHDGKIEEKQGSYWYEGKLIFWHSLESYQAQHFCKTGKLVLDRSE